MTGMRRATVAVAATVVLSGLAGAAAGCAGGAGSAGAAGAEGGGVTAAKHSLAPVDGQARGASAAPVLGSGGSAGTAAGRSAGARADVSGPVRSAGMRAARLGARGADGQFGGGV